MGPDVVIPFRVVDMPQTRVLVSQCEAPERTAVHEHLGRWQPCDSARGRVQVEPKPVMEVVE